MDSSPNVHVGILKGKRIEFRLSGKFEISGKSANCFGACIAEVNNKGIKIHNNDKEFNFAREVVFLPCNISSDSFEMNDVVIGIDFHWEQRETQSFRGALKLLLTGDEIQVINIIPIENYLISVISSEMNAESSPELLKAHAIISRSWLMAQIREDGRKKVPGKNKTIASDEDYIHWYDREDHHDFHVCADDHCQRYQGISRATNPSVIEAVTETHGRVLTYKGDICDTRYSKACGGKSESFESCWEDIKHPYLVPVIDSEDDTVDPGDLGNEKTVKKFITDPPPAFCDTKDEKILQQVLNDYDRSEKDYFRWEVRYSQKDLSELVSRRSEIDFGRIKDLLPVKRGHSGRLIKLKIAGEKKEMIIGKELVIRRWLSESHLKSSAFIIEKEGEVEGFPESFILKGAGWGHGVGLCQIGAAVMGEKGYSHQEILKHYYQNAVITKLYS